ncbi:2,3-bisphosphoglycerate-independent phosphoglycerate mutase, partial [Candidatus Micrarchaeota archaeon]|nr:2,3-bisphosphoglycerate-independent phosphoglycerate mutase [Candidatus Micrarchaeota archaeon]MBU1929890.1 2,3-bisphosphoglycerate-independent phosphoglycerate mutase [Candidatus Micrarchaeota archaeon]
MKPGVLIILDGIGLTKQKKGNAFALAKTPFLDSITREYGKIVLKASGTSVGLPKGFMGNSEVGHIALGAGRTVLEAMERINQSIQNKSFFCNPAFLKAIQNCKKNNSSLHVMGLVSDKGVHSTTKHLFALLELCKQHQLKKVWIHFFTDGRDSKPKQALEYLKTLEREMRKKKIGKIGTVIGRFFAMDRDKRWNRTQKAFECLVHAKGLKAQNARQAIQNAYKRKETDEFFSPTVLSGFEGIQKNDSVIFFNFRLDRQRQLTQAMVEKKFSGFKRKRPEIVFAAFCPYYDSMNATVAFTEPNIKNSLGEVLSKKKWKQLRIAETEKYAHATYFFNGENEKPFKGEKRKLFASPKVKTYEKTPLMRTPAITKHILTVLRQKKFDAIIANFANGDMIGHTGNLKSAIKAVQGIDRCLSQIVSLVLCQKGFVIITADHGNCESMGISFQKREKNH